MRVDVDIQSPELYARGVPHREFRYLRQPGQDMTR